MCVDYDVCDCNKGWKGLSCSVPDCTILNECNGNGDCVGPDKCDCYSGHVGTACNLTLDCHHLNNCSGQGLCVLNRQEELACR